MRVPKDPCNVKFPLVPFGEPDPYGGEIHPLKFNLVNELNGEGDTQDNRVIIGNLQQDEISIIKLKDIPLYIKHELDRQLAGTGHAQQDALSLCIEKGLDRMLAIPEYSQWCELTELGRSKKVNWQDHPSLYTDFCALSNRWYFALDRGNCGVYYRNLRLPKEQANQIHKVAEKIGLSSNELVQIVTADALRSQPEAVYGDVMDRSIDTFYKSFRRRLFRLTSELKIDVKIFRLSISPEVSLLLDEIS